jgi:hypothetical protein
MNEIGLCEKGRSAKNCSRPLATAQPKRAGRGSATPGPTGGTPPSRAGERCCTPSAIARPEGSDE